jgi:hypothetical protein
MCQRCSLVTTLSFEVNDNVGDEDICQCDRKQIEHHDELPAQRCRFNIIDLQYFAIETRLKIKRKAGK